MVNFRIQAIRPPVSLLSLAVVAFSCWAASAGEQPAVRGVVRYAPPGDEAGVPERFRLEANTFWFEERKLPAVSEAFDVSLVTFPSPVKTPHPRNNTVHCEYYRPRGEGKTPAVVVLHILGGDFQLSRIFCHALADRGVAALFVKLPYYGPRRDPDEPRRMIARDPHDTVEGMTQAVLDIRRATAWLAAREEVDAQQLGVLGISLGGITGALAAAAEPRLQNVCLLLAGGDIGRIGWESPILAEVRRSWTAEGGTREEFFEVISSIDPVCYAANLRGRRILMLNAKDDELIPRSCTVSLWKAMGEPEIVWYDGGHYSAVKHFFDALRRVTEFFDAEV